MTILDRADWLGEWLAQVPAIILHLREQAVPSMQARQDGRVSGSREQATLPLRVEPVDAADELWAQVCSLAEEFAEHAGIEPPAALARQWINRTGSVDRVHGFASSNPYVIHAEAFEVTQWLVKRSWSLALDPRYTQSVDVLCELIDRLRDDAAAFSGYSFKSYRPDPCSNCDEYSLLPQWRDGQLAAIVCEYCGSRRPVERRG